MADKILIIMVSLLLFLLPTACISTPSPTPTAPPPLSSGSMPANYTTYTDESGLFNISYPSDWELALWEVPIGQDREKAIDMLQSGIPIQEDTQIFLAGKKFPEFPTYVTIDVVPVPTVVSAHDQMVDSMLQIVRQAYPDLTELSSVKTTVDGKEATILEWEGTIPEEQTTFHCLQLYTLTDKAIWVVTCGSPHEEFTQWRNDFNTIVRSLHISH